MKINPEFRCTLVVLMGKPKLVESQNHDSETKEENQNMIKTQEELSLQNVGYHVHSNFNFVHSLITIMSKNYPERLMMARSYPMEDGPKFLAERTFVDIFTHRELDPE